MSQSNKKLMRWKWQLMDYNIAIKHRPGKQNILPDILSRSGGVWVKREVRTVKSRTGKTRSEMRSGDAKWWVIVEVAK